MGSLGLFLFLFLVFIPHFVELGLAFVNFLLDFCIQLGKLSILAIAIGIEQFQLDFQILKFGNGGLDFLNERVDVLELLVSFGGVEFLGHSDLLDLLVDVLLHVLDVHLHAYCLRQGQLPTEDALGCISLTLTEFAVNLRKQVCILIVDSDCCY